jgi:hypothetical protein
MATCPQFYRQDYAHEVQGPSALLMNAKVFFLFVSASSLCPTAATIALFLNQYTHSQ